jgi:hypothetical protein
MAGRSVDPRGLSNSYTDRSSDGGPVTALLMGSDPWAVPVVVFVFLAAVFSVFGSLVAPIVMTAG